MYETYEISIIVISLVMTAHANVKVHQNDQWKIVGSWKDAT